MLKAKTIATKRIHARITLLINWSAIIRGTSIVMVGLHLYVQMALYVIKLPVVRNVCLKLVSHVIAVLIVNKNLTVLTLILSLEYALTAMIHANSAKKLVLESVKNVFRVTIQHKKLHQEILRAQNVQMQCQIVISVKLLLYAKFVIKDTI